MPVLQPLLERSGLTPLQLAGRALLPMAMAVCTWALRHGRWLMKPRIDGQPG